jgi:hypothetical protein
VRNVEEMSEKENNLKKLQQSVSKYKYFKNRLLSLLSNMSDRDKTH